ncbi:DNA methyltransferase [uncultured Enterococcus sp.]|uniref:DNA methyltransferase n=1 Tax=uncultured Enterococcus sp. TaxID=167972 RepID=UPI002AA89223|nr:DNA methyltransferase [uncultured Enterococcus sp.]
MIVWALFDSGNGCYKRSAQKFDDIEIYSIGLDIENKNDHFIHLNLADYSYMFGNNELYETLDALPSPDLIIASPPCESWSIASAMRGGNASWKQETGDGLFEPQMPLSRFTIRDYKEYENYQFKPEKSLINRINGELCTFNTIQIIKRYSPAFYIIENPASSRIWEYIESVLGFELLFDNMTYYGNYDYPVKKGTKFKSNLSLDLQQTKPDKLINLKILMRKYNERSNIPEKLVDEIFEKVLDQFKQIK